MYKEVVKFAQDVDGGEIPSLRDVDNGEIHVDGMLTDFQRGDHDLACNSIGYFPRCIRRQSVPFGDKYFAPGL
jgi:hypothetical protein